MLTTLALTSALFAAQPPTAMRLLAQADAPLVNDRLDVSARIEAITLELRDLKVEWPKSAVVLASVGLNMFGLLGYAGYIIVIGNLQGGAFGPPDLGTGLLVAAVAGLMVGLVGAVLGHTHLSATKARRELLLDERKQLERELDAPQRAPAPAVERTAPSGATVLQFT